MSTFTLTITVDYTNLRVGMESVYPGGSRVTHEPSTQPDRDGLNQFLVYFLQGHSEVFGETCIHILKFGTVEEASNAK